MCELNMKGNIHFGILWSIFEKPKLEDREEVLAALVAPPFFKSGVGLSCDRVCSFGCPLRLTQPERRSLTTQKGIQSRTCGFQSFW